MLFFESFKTIESIPKTRHLQCSKKYLIIYKPLYLNFFSD